MSDSLTSKKKQVIPTEPSVAWHLYIVKCRNGTLYTGITTDVDRRFAEHQKGGLKAARYLRGKGPLELVFRTVAGDRAQASVLEYRIKALSRAAKQELIAGKMDVAEAHSVAPVESNHAQRD